MRPLKSHFRDDALTTLETVLKQTKEARVFRRAQAVQPSLSASPHEGLEPTPSSLRSCRAPAAGGHWWPLSLRSAFSPTSLLGGVCAVASPRVTQGVPDA